MCPAKMAELIEMPLMGPGNHRVQIPPWEEAIFRGERGVPL